MVRNGNQKTVEVILKKLEVYEIKDIGIEVAEVLPDALKRYNIKGGVSIKRVLRTDISRYALQGNIITKLDDIAVKSVNDIRKIISTRDASQPIKMTFINKNAETFSYIFR